MAKHTEDFLRQIEGDLEKEFAQDFFREVRAVFQNYEDKVAGVYRDTVTQFSTNEVEVEDLVNRFSNWSKDQRIHYLGVIDRMIHSALVRTHERHLTHLGISADPADDASDSE